MIPPKYRFYISVNNDTKQQINPHYKTLSKKYQKENGQEFFRESLDGKITLHGQDYEIVKNSNLEDRLELIIDKYDDGSKLFVEYYRGEFNKTDCVLNYDKKVCEPKITIVDSYANILNKYDNAYNIINLAPEIERIKYRQRPAIQVYIKGSNTFSCFFAGTYYEESVNEVVDSEETLAASHFALIQQANELQFGSLIMHPESYGLYVGNNGSYTISSGKYSLRIIKVFSKGSIWTLASNLRVQCVQDGDFKQVNINSDNILQEDLYKMRCIRTSDNTVIYESHEYLYTESDRLYINTGDIDIRMDYKLNTSAASYLSLIQSILYSIYSRLIYNGVRDDIKDEGYNISANDFISDNRNYKKCIGFTGGSVYITAMTVNTPTKYGINDYGQYFTNKFIPSTSITGRILPICRSAWGNASVWFMYGFDYNILDDQYSKTVTIRDSWSIASVIKVLLNEIDPNIQHEATSEYSQFLYGQNMPIYPSNRFYVYLTQKTNILKTNYDQPAQKAEVSLENIMNMLRDCFRCYWYIENNKLKIEHISFFINGGSYSINSNIQLDFTRLTDQFNKKLSSYFQSEIEYDKDELSQRYEFSWMDDATDLFTGLAIDVNSNYVQKDKTEEINVNQFSSDVDYMMFNPSSFSEDGFALLCPIMSHSSLELPIIEASFIDENNDSYNALVQNWYAAWAYLANFYMYDMPAFDITNNSVNNLSVHNIKMCMSNTIEMPIKNDLNILELIKTPIGNGKIDNYSVNLDTRVAKIELIYRPQ